MGLVDKNTKHTSKTVAKRLKDNKFKVLEWPGGLQTLLSSTSPVMKNRPKFQQLNVRSLWKATQNKTKSYTIKEKKQCYQILSVCK